MERVVGVDIGYGNTKVTDGEREIRFRSLVAPAGPDLSGGAFGAREVTRVRLDGAVYEVGNDAVPSPGSALPLHDRYPESVPYRALLRTALTRTSGCWADILVSGLPVTLFEKSKAPLKTLLAGPHALDDGRVFRIGRVALIPQPLGGLLDYLQGEGSWEEALSRTVLVLDVGHYTVDWLVVRRLKPVSGRSGSSPHGVFRIAEQISGALRRTFGGGPDPVFVTDALAAGCGTVSAKGRTVDLDQYRTEALEAVRPPLESAILASIGEAEDIDYAVVCGGGAGLYQTLARTLLPNTEIRTVRDSAMAIVRGYAIYGRDIVGGGRA